jgi:phosphopantetheinyl transferase
MKIFYLKKDEFLKSVDKICLEKFSDERKYKSEEKFLEHLCGIFLTKFVAQKFYNIKNTDIKIENGKPYFPNTEIFFSISHSKNIIAVGFDKNNLGIDVEYMENRNFKRVLERYNQSFDNPTPKDFYNFWTIHEATIKLGSGPKSTSSSVLEKYYAISCVSEVENTMPVKIINLTLEAIQEMNSQG